MWYIKTHILPVYLSSGSSALAEHEVNDPTKIPPSPPSGLLIGSIHTGVLEVLISESGLGSGSGPGNTNPVPVPGIKIKTLRLDTAYGKYIFTRDVFDSSFPHDLPEGYTFGKLGDTHYDLVRSRTRIYRSDESLRHMHGVGVYRTDQTKEPIGWAFISLDGSLATLHVEPGHRGKGLAVQLAKETMRRGDGGGDGYAHTDVDLENSASRRVMEKIGGQLKWTVAWVVVEVVDL